MALESSEFRRILGHWTTGVAIVATIDGAGEPRGLTANAVASVSLDPPLVLACVERSADSHDVIAQSGIFTISILEQSAEAVARRFADDDPDKFRGLAWEAKHTGAPVLHDALAWVDCTIHEQCDGGDHTIFIGRVVAGEAREGEPLLFYRGGYAGLTP